MEPEYTLGKPASTITPENLTPMVKINSSTTTPLSASAGTFPAQLPDIAVDPMLAKAMREAQVGLFATRGQEQS
jgi:hypothetical protein